MRSPLAIIVVIIFLAVAGIGLYAFSQNSLSDSSIPKEESVVKDEIATASGQMMDNQSAKYVEYSKAILDSSVSGRRVLFFYANWCPICRPADTNFKENIGKIPGDVTLIRVNYNDTDTDQEEKDLAKQYGITYQHTFVQIDEDGREITKWNGGQINEFLTNIK